MNITFILPSSLQFARQRKERMQHFYQVSCFFILMQYICLGIDNWTICHMINIHACKYPHKCLDRWSLIFTTKIQISLETCFTPCGPLAYAIASFQVHKARFNSWATSMEQIPHSLFYNRMDFPNTNRLVFWSQIKI